jgi:hypothetical protein
VADSNKRVSKNEEFKYRKTVNCFPKLKEAFTVKLKMIFVDHHLIFGCTKHRKIQKIFSRKYFMSKQTEHILNLSNFNSTLSVHNMRWLLKSLFDQNYHLINHMSNGYFKCYLIFLWTLDEHLIYMYDYSLNLDNETTFKFYNQIHFTVPFFIFPSTINI